VSFFVLLTGVKIRVLKPESPLIKERLFIMLKNLNKKKPQATENGALRFVFL
jgi:hypothetical protein